MIGTLQERLQAAFPAAQRALHDRILLRSCADLDHTLATIGTGAPSTFKRATALQMALDGHEIAAIAKAAGLPEPRVEQVLENVLASGTASLYPRFAETVPLPDGMTYTQLWAIVEPIIRSTPSSRGVRSATWQPALVLDFLVFDGTLPDLDIASMESLIKRCLDPNNRPLTFEYTDVRHAARTRMDAWGPLVMVLAGIGIIGAALSWRSEIGTIWVVLLLLFGLLYTFVSAMLLVKQVLERRVLNKILAKKTKQGSAAVAALPASPAAHSGVRTSVQGSALPAPNVTILHALALPPAPWKLDNITDTSNALGQPPIRVLYLWVFAAQYDQGGFETEGWPQLGPVHLLLNATALGIGQLAGPTRKFLVSDRAGLDDAISGYTDRAGTYERPGLFITGIAGKRPYCGYPIHTLVCNDEVWKPAVHQLAARCDLAVVNLSGYNPSHPGLEYEIHHLLRGGPPAKFLFVCERTTDADAVISSVLDAWYRIEVAPGAPVPAPPELIFLRIPDSQEVGYALQFSKPWFGTGWLATVHLDREGSYVPIAGQVLNYLNRSPEGAAD